MITKSNWTDALDAWVAEERERLGDPPTPEEIVAFLRGGLPPPEAARVQALLVYNPELTPLLAERSDRLRATRKRTSLRIYAGAVTLAAVLLGTDAMQQRRRSAEPSLPSSHHEFNALLARGPAPVYELPAGQERYLITAVPSAPPAEPAYELQILRGSRVLWSARDVRPVADTFVIYVPGRFLAPGTYTLNVLADGHLVDRYPFRVRE
jgi:anti-sigma factor RsiW